jgi:hypothetical protein
MATTSISGLPETTTINTVTVAPVDFGGGTFKVTVATLGSFINTNATTISATGNITGGNILFGSGIISGTGTVSAAGTVLTGNISAAGYQGGASGLSISGNVTGGNLRTGGLISATGTVTGGALATAGTAVASTFSATGTTAAVFAATNAGLEVGNPTASNTPYIDFFTSASSSLDYDSRILASGGTNGVVNGTGTLSLVGASIVTPGTFTVNSGAAATAIVNGAANAVGNIGSSTTYFNNIFAQATTALYADLAEVYEGDTDYTPGTVVSFGGTKEVTVSATEGDPTVAGVISANPSYLMNNGLTADHRAIVALTGRVHTSVTGAVTKGAMMVSAGNGHARASAAPAMGTVIGKALENFDGESGIIEIVVGRM